jgi:hypothetical protein
MKKEKRTSVLLLLMMLSVMLVVPSTVSAYDNKIEGGLAIGEGDSVAADYSMFGIGVEYTRYFTSVTTSSSPYGAREFLQHPSYAGGSILMYNFEEEAALGTAKEETDGMQISMGGMYYLGGGNTGLGLTLGKADEETDIYVGGALAGTGEEDIMQFTFSANHYLNSTLRLEASIAEENHDLGAVEYDQRVIGFGASTLLQDKFWISGRLNNGEIEVPGGGDIDIQGIELTGGMYPNQKIGVFLHLGKETVDYGITEDETTTFGVEGDFYFNENMHLDAMLTLANEETSPGGGDTDYQIIDVAFGYMFYLTQDTSPRAVLTGRGPGRYSTPRLHPDRASFMHPYMHQIAKAAKSADKSCKLFW